MSESPRSWFITGVSSGFGQELADAALARGDKVAAVFRKKEQAQAFSARVPGRSAGLLLDLEQRDKIAGIVDAAAEALGGLDIIVNNAGYGLAGALEEISAAELEHQMAINFLAPAAIIQAALPYLRRQRHGHIINISSMAGFRGAPGLGVYCASKFALEGLSDSLAMELKPLGIAVTIVAPGAFRTKWAGGGLIEAARTIDEYAASAGRTRTALRRDVDGKQRGDAAKGARAIIAVVDAAEPPLRLALGADSVASARQKIAVINAELERWEKLSNSTDHS